MRLEFEFVGDLRQIAGSGPICPPTAVSDCQHIECFLETRNLNAAVFVSLHIKNYYLIIRICFLHKIPQII